MNKRNLLSALLVFLTPIVIFGQSISGTISGDGKPLVGANIVVEGSQLGTVSVLMVLFLLLYLLANIV